MACFLTEKWKKNNFSRHSSILSLWKTLYLPQSFGCLQTECADMKSLCYYYSSQQLSHLLNPPFCGWSYLLNIEHSLSATTRESDLRCPMSPPHVPKASEGGSAVTGTPWGLWPGRGVIMLHAGIPALLLGTQMSRICHGVAFAEAATHRQRKQLSHALHPAVSPWVTVRHAVARASVEFVAPPRSGSRVWLAPCLRFPALF